MVDLEIEFHPDRNPYYANQRPVWRLPKHPGMSKNFLGAEGLSRVTFGGLLAKAVSGTTQRVDFSIPNDHAVVATYLDPRHSNVVPAPTPPARQFSHLGLSDKGFYLRGLMRLFGTMSDACRTVQEPFWREVLLEMSGRPEAHVERLAGQIQEVVTTALSDGALEAGSDRIGPVSEALARRLRGIAPSSRKYTVKELRDDYNRRRNEVQEGDAEHHYWRDNPKEFLKDDLLWLLEKSVLQQGVDLACPECGSTAWYPADAVGREVICSGCLAPFTMKAEPAWSFRANPLVENALGMHGCLPILQAWNFVLTQAPGAVILLPCMDLFEDFTSPGPVTDLDLVAVANQELIIGEVKSNTAGFRVSDVETLGRVAKALAPNRVVLAAPKGEWPDEILTAIDTLSTELARHLVKVSRWNLEWDPLPFADWD